MENIGAGSNVSEYSSNSHWVVFSCKVKLTLSIIYQSGFIKRQSIENMTNLRGNESVRVTGVFYQTGHGYIATYTCMRRWFLSVY